MVYLTEMINIRYYDMTRMFRLTIGQVYESQKIVTTLSLLSDAQVTTNQELGAVLNAVGYVDTNGIPIYPFRVGSIAEALAAAQRPSLSYEFIRIKAPYMPTLILEGNAPSGSVGTIGTPGDSAPFVSASVKSNKVRGDIRAGFKRVAGVPQDAILDGGELSAAYQTTLGAFGAALAISSPGSNGAFSVNVSVITEKLFKNTVNGQIRYTDWENETEALANIAQPTQWTASPFITTQNSRKRGRGQ